MKIYSLIGFETLKECELQLDYVRKEVQFKQIEKVFQGVLLLPKRRLPPSMDMDYIGHLVCITTHVGSIGCV